MRQTYLLLIICLLAVSITANAQCGATSVTALPQPLMICEGDSEMITFTASGTCSGTYEYEVLDGTTVVQAWGTPATFNAAPTDSTTYTLNARCSACPTTVATSTFTIDVLEQPTVTGNLTLCMGETTTLTASGNGTLEWWDNSVGGTQLSATNIFNTPALSDTTTYWVHVSSTSSGATTGSILITECGVEGAIGGTGSEDYIEISNLYTTSVNTSGWVVAVSDSYSNINTYNSILWNLPATFSPCSVVTKTDASSYPNYWGNNIFWNSGSSSWAIIIDNTGNVVDFIAWGWTAAQLAGFNPTINGFPITLGTEWIGNGCVAACGTTGGIQYSFARTGNADNNDAADFVCQPTSVNVVNPTLSCGWTTSASCPYPVTVVVNPLIINAGVDQTVCDGSLITLTGTGASSYTWDNGVTNNAPFTQPIGTTTYTVTGMDVNGCTNSDAVDVTVTPPPAINAGTDQILCNGTSVVLNASGAGTGGTYNWNNGVPNGVPFIQTTGTTTYTVTGTDANGCVNTDQLDITVNSVPIVNAGIDQTVCEGASVTLTASGSTTYSWDNSVTNGVAFTPAVGTITYTVSGTTSGCTSSDQVVVIVNPLPIVVAPKDSVLCEHQSIILVGSGASNYSWDNGITNGVAFTPTATTTYTVTGTDANGCVNTDMTQLTVIPTPIADFSSDKTLDCSPLIYTLTNNSTGTLTNCQWTLSNGQTFTGCGNISDTLFSVGCYDITLIISTPEGCTNTLTKSDYICVAPDPVANFYADPNELNSLVSSTTMTNVSTGATSYEWNFGDNSGVFTEENPTHDYPTSETKTFTIVLVATSDVGCVDSTSETVSVVEDLIYYIPNTFTPDMDSYNETFTPIFTSGFDPQDYTLLIFNRWGEILFESHDAKVGWDGTFNGKIAQDGTYIWKIMFKLANTDERQEHHGNINLVR